MIDLGNLHQYTEAQLIEFGLIDGDQRIDGEVLAGDETWLTVDFLNCVEGRADQVDDGYKRLYDGVTLPGFTKDGRSGASVNHSTLAGGIASYKDPSSAKRWWQDVMDHWWLDGTFFIEDGTRNVYFSWIMFPMMAALQEHDLLDVEGHLTSVWARMALGASHKPCRYGVSLDLPEGMWRGYATTWLGGRSWKYNAPHWSHQEKCATDWILHWAINNNTSEAPADHFARTCINAGLPSGLQSTDRPILKFIIEGSTRDLNSALVMANLGRTHNEVTIIRTVNGTMTLGHKSHNGNTQYMYGVTTNHQSQWNEWMGHGDGTRTVKHGKGWHDDELMECEDNDKTEEDSISMPTGTILYHIKTDGRGLPWAVVGSDPPPVEDALTQEQRDHYVSEMQSMANRQQQLTDQLRDTKSFASDSDVAIQDGHQSRKAARLSREIADILDIEKQTRDETTAKP